MISVVASFLTACIPTGLNMAPSPLLRFLERKAGRIIYIGEDANLYTIDQGGGRQKAITTDGFIPDTGSGPRRVYQFPAWAPDGQHLAFVGINATDTQVDSASLYIASADGDDRVEVFKSDAELPIYLYWSPDSQAVGFLTKSATTEDSTLHLVPAQGGESQQLVSGSPLFWSWAPDNHSILVHRGDPASGDPQTELKLVSLEGSAQAEKLNVSPIQFQSPSWSPNGQDLLLALKDSGKDVLALANRKGAIRQVIDEVDGPVSFGWSPDGKKIAYMSGAGLLGPFGTLSVVDADQPEKKTTITEDGLAGFFWSLDGRKLAYFTSEGQVPVPSASGSGNSGQSQLLKLTVLDSWTGKSQMVTEFIPTLSFLGILSAFDQYQHSITIWSPDSRNLVLSSYNTSGQPGIYVVEASRNLKPLLVTGGYLGFWSWR